MDSTPANISSYPVPVQVFFCVMGTFANPGSITCYDAVTNKLVPFYWPVDHRKDRVPPALFAYHRSKYHFQNPFCFCSLSRGDLINREAAVYMPLEGPFKNKFVAACAAQRCVYFVPLQNFHHLAETKVKYYPQRIDGDHGPAPILHISETQAPNASATATASDLVEDADDEMSDGSDTDMEDLDDELKAVIASMRQLIPPTRRPLQLPATSIIVWPKPQEEPLSFYAMTLLLDAIIRPGVPVSSFLSLTALCPCGILTSARAFSAHKCMRESPTANEYVPRHAVNEMLRKLDTVINPGVLLAEFLRFVVQCDCGVLVTRRGFLAHPCIFRGSAV